ncbi:MULTISPECIES: HdeA/HdeB family chaperone [unclassified Roseivivax]|uniref:HdeA/HdeB family chaperone n=1 Tax=Roseivivax sp. GX 12232 TaxID=2900547 RepID=UPI001E61E672|nr:HdeA/HdeB family chaperone [Roseivivax sp. GX 12232]MCE0506064.1 hypothetical protein [Roseivivax sp. GX 12232]
MKTTASIAAVLGLALSTSAAFGAAHAMDPNEVTCADFLSMDDEGKMGVAEAVVAELESMEDADAAMIEIDGACQEDESISVLTAATAGANE